MPKVFIVEPDPKLREWCRLHLSAENVDVMAFEDTRRALDALRLDLPDLVLVATNVAGFSAFALAAALRSNVRTALIPILFMAPSGDAEALVQAQAVDPHGVMTKPFSRQVLMEAVAARVPTAGAAPGVWGSRASARPRGFEHAAASGPLLEAKLAAVLVVVLRNFVSLSRALSAQHLDRFLSHFANATRQSIFDQGGWVVRSDALTTVALFDEASNLERTPACRGLEAALAAVVAARRAKKWADGALSKTGVPDLSVGCGVHTGEVIVARLSAGGTLTPNIAGQTVDLAYRLDGRAKGLHWSVAASQGALLEAGTRFQGGREATLTDTDHGLTISISEVLGLNPGTAKPGELVYMGEVREAVVANTLLARLAGDVDQLTADRTLMVTARARAREEALPEIPERRIQKRLKHDDVTETFSVVHLPSNREELVTLLPIEKISGSVLAGYLEDCRKLSSIEQRNVAAVHETGQTEQFGFVALEYLPGDSLADRLRRQVPVGVALNCVAQGALALDAIHQIGIVHGELKAEHFRFRRDGAMVLADFNVMARVCASLGVNSPTDKTTWLGGHPGATLLEATPRADFCALGRIMHALVTGEGTLLDHLPDTSEALFKGSRLPLPLTPLQACLDALLGVGGASPVNQAEDVLVSLFDIRAVFPFDLRLAEPEADAAARKLG